MYAQTRIDHRFTALSHGAGAGRRIGLDLRARLRMRRATLVLCAATLAGAAHATRAVVRLPVVRAATQAAVNRGNNPVPKVL